MEQWRGFVRDSLADLAKHGFVEVHEMLSPAWLGPMLAELDRAGELRTTVWLYPPLDSLEEVARGRLAWEGPHVRLAGGKVFADGTLNARTAWMLAPYADAMPGSPRGHEMMNVEQLRDAIRRCRSFGVGLAVHAIGDGAVRASLDAWEEEGTKAQRHEGTEAGAWASAANGLPAMRIEHCEMIDAVDVPRFAELGVVCSVQPCHLLYDIEALERGQPRRLDRVLPLRELIASGCRPGELLWFGSDVPIVRPNPEDSVRAAMDRRRIEGSPGGTASRAIAPEQAITEEECWRAFSLTIA
jgi:predicted amidohydrolase YtcJ